MWWLYFSLIEISSLGTYFSSLLVVNSGGLVVWEKLLHMLLLLPVLLQMEKTME